MIFLEQVKFGWTKAQDLIDIEDLQIPQGEKVLIKGPSGCGKTTLLSLLTGIQTVDSGCLKVKDRDLKKLRPHERDRFRGDHIGYIFQQFNLIPWLTIEDNIMAPLLFSKLKTEKEGGDHSEKVIQLLEALSLQEKPSKKAKDLSIGQQQRVAVARALIGNPEIIIADEPASALDEDRKDEFLRLLFRECDKRGATLIVVSHDSHMDSLFERVIPFQDINRGVYV